LLTATFKNLHIENIANFVPNFVGMATGIGQGKMQLAAFDGPSSKTPHRRKNLLRKPSYSPFCPNFVAMATKVSRGKCSWQHLMAHPRKLPYRHKNLLRKLSYSPFCLKFCCHGNGGRSGGNAIGSIRWPIPEKPL